MSIFKKILLLPLGFILYPMSWILPKKKYRYIFGAWHGKKYADSPRFLFEYIVKYHPEIEAFWITKNKRIYKDLTTKKLPVLKAFSPYTWWFIATAQVAFISISAKDIRSYLLTSRHYIVQLWHGIPVKKIGFDTLKNHGFLYWAFRLFPWYHLKYSLFPTTSGFTQQLFSKAFLLDPKKCPPLGSPRTDFIVSHPSLPENIFLYAPTYRKNHDYLREFYDQLNITEKSLKHLQHCLIARMHNENRSFIKNEMLVDFDHIALDESDEILDILLKSQVLITDFSSIMFDYLLVDRPIIFYVPDLEKYQKNERELYFDFLKFAPGPIVYNWRDVLKELEILIIEKNDAYQQKRKIMQAQFFEHPNGQNCKRIVEYLTLAPIPTQVKFPTLT